MNARALSLMLLVGCTGVGKDSGPATTTETRVPGDTDSGIDSGADTSSEADPITAAMGSCTASLSAVDGSGAPFWTATRTYNADGDEVFWDEQYLTDRRCDHTTISTYGSPHEAATVETDLAGRCTLFTAATETDTWSDGDKTGIEMDYGNNGSIDEIGVQVFEDHRMTHWEWDEQGDGVFEDTADFTWTPDGEEWDVVGAGEDANGPYSSAEVYDSGLRRTSYQYRDSTGVEVDEVRGEFSVLGELGVYSSQWFQDGVVTYTDDETQSFDALGRVIEGVQDQTWITDGTTDTLHVDTTISWDCP